MPNQALFDCTLQNYQIVDQETRQAVEVTKRFVNSVLLGNPSHLVLTGKQGTGKSHLAMAAAWEVLKRSNYDKKSYLSGYRKCWIKSNFRTTILNSEKRLRDR